MTLRSGWLILGRDLQSWLMRAWVSLSLGRQLDKDFWRNYSFFSFVQSTLLVISHGSNFEATTQESHWKRWMWFIRSRLIISAELIWCFRQVLSWTWNGSEIAKKSLINLLHLLYFTFHCRNLTMSIILMELFFEQLIITPEFHHPAFFH